MIKAIRTAFMTVALSFVTAMFFQCISPEYERESQRKCRR